MDRRAPQTCVIISVAAVLMGMLVALDRQHPDLQHRPGLTTALPLRTGLQLEAAYDGQSLASVITSGWVDVDSADGVLVRVSPYSYVSLPSPDWKTKVGSVDMSLKMNHSSEYVWLELSHEASADEVSRACAQTLRGEPSPADIWTVSIRACEQD